MLLAVAIAAGPIAFTTADRARAQTVFTTVQAFGDSYADNGNIFRLVGVPFPVEYPTGRFSGGTNFIDTTAELLGVPQFNYALGGAQTGTTNVGPGLPGFFQEWAGFVASGRRFSSSDLIEISIGGNDARDYYQNGGTLAGVPTAAATSAAQATAGINALVGAGARNIVFTIGDVSTLPEANGVPSAAIGSAFSQTYNALMQQSLAGVARSGVRVEWVDIALIGNRITANPAAYGLASAGACPLACIGNPTLQSQYLFYFDQVHLTSRGFEILGQYIVNRLFAPLSIAPQGDVSLNSAMGFATTLFGRLDSFRETSGAMATAMNSYAQVAKARPLYTKAPSPVMAAPNPWSFYIQANGGISDRHTTVAANGFDLESVGGTVGAEYRIGGNAMIGGAFDYSNPKAKLYNNAGRIAADSYQLGLYGGWTDAHFFAQALGTIGWQKFHNTRNGIIDTVGFSPDGMTVVAAGKIGYLFDAGRTGIGPIAGLTYARAKVNSYTETGDAALTLSVGDQVAEALVGSAGGQIRFPFLINGRIISPYVNLTAEDDFIGDGRIIQYSATSAPLIVNNWSVPDGSHRVYGRVAAGVVAPVSDTVALTANLSSTFARQGGNDFYGNGGLKISF
jgi:outer membrane autotransporter protein